MKSYISFLLFVACLFGACGRQNVTEVSSPDGHIRLTFDVDDHNRMNYQISVNDTFLVAPSQLGFIAQDGVNLFEGFVWSVPTFLLLTRHGHSLGERIRHFVIIITKWLFTCPMRQVQN